MGGLFFKDSRERAWDCARDRKTPFKVLMWRGGSQGRAVRRSASAAVRTCAPATDGRACLARLKPPRVNEGGKNGHKGIYRLNPPKKGEAGNIEHKGGNTINIKNIREAQGLSQRHFAEHLGVSKSYITQIETGKRPLPPELEAKIKEHFLSPTPSELRLTASFDWLSLHFRTCDVAEVVSEILHLDLINLCLEDYGRYRYPFYYRYGSINIYANTKDERQGVTIECSGTACRELEALLFSQERDLYDLFSDCLLYENELKEKNDSLDSEHYFNVTRCDLALDEAYCEAENYDLTDLYERFKQGLVSTRKRDYNVYIGGKIDGEAGEITLYIGSRKSNLFFRFYEKDKEQAKKFLYSLEEVHELYGFKNRYEIVMRKEKADQFIRDYVATYFDLAKIGIGIINDNMTVYSEDGYFDVNWHSLMSENSAYQLKTAPKVTSLSRVWRWAEHAVFPTLHFLKMMDEERFTALLEEAMVPKRYLPYLKAKKKQEEQ